MINPDGFTPAPRNAIQSTSPVPPSLLGKGVRGLGSHLHPILHHRSPNRRKQRDRRGYFRPDHSRLNKPTPAEQIEAQLQFGPGLLRRSGRSRECLGEPGVVDVRSLFLE